MTAEEAYWAGLGPEYDQDDPFGELERDRDVEIDARKDKRNGPNDSDRDTTDSVGGRE